MEVYHGGSEKAPDEPTLEHLSRICAEMNRRGVRYVVVGGFAVILHGYPRYTTDIDFLIETTAENEQAALDALLVLPEGAARQVRAGEVGEYGVVRVGDQIIVDLMKSGCGVTYEDAIGDAVTETVDGVQVRIASVPVLWRMKQTVREKDVPDRLFLRQKLEEMGIAVSPPESAGNSAQEVPQWVISLIRFVRRLFGSRAK